jgi:hypothetical protein
MKINFDKKTKSLLAIYAILLFVLVILFAAIPFRKIAAGWIAFVFCIVSIVIGFFITIYAFKKDEEPISKVYGFPVFRVGALYTIAQLLVGVIVCVIGSVVIVPVWIVLVISIILLAVAAIGVIATDNTRDIITEQDASVAESTKQVTLFNLDIANVIDCCSKPEIKADLGKLAEEFRYSDPVSSDETKEIETVIADKICILKDSLTTDSDEALKAKILEIKNSLAERNRICKAAKR